MVPRQLRPLVAVLLIAVAALSTTVVYLYKDLASQRKFFNEQIQYLNQSYQNKLDSLSTVILAEKEKSKQEVISRLEEIIEQQNLTLEYQRKHKTEQKGVVTINNNIIQQNSHKIKQLQNE